MKARVAITLIFIALLLICLTGFYFWMQRQRGAALSAELAIDILNYKGALLAYSNHFGILPVGGNATVTAALAGSNEQHLIFLKFGQPSKLNPRGEFLDPYARPYDIEVTTNRIRIAPRPQ